MNILNAISRALRFRIPCDNLSPATTKKKKKRGERIKNRQREREREGEKMDYRDVNKEESH